MMRIEKNTRVETVETPSGRLRERTVSTWCLVDSFGLISEHETKRDALAAKAEGGGRGAGRTALAVRFTPRELELIFAMVCIAQANGMGEGDYAGDVWEAADTEDALESIMKKLSGGA